MHPPPHMTCMYPPPHMTTCILLLSSYDMHVSSSAGHCTPSSRLARASLLVLQLPPSRPSLCSLSLSLSVCRVCDTRRSLYYKVKTGGGLPTSGGYASPTVAGGIYVYICTCIYIYVYIHIYIYIYIRYSTYSRTPLTQ